MAVVAPVKLDDFVATRHPTGKANGGHRSLGARRHEPNAVRVSVVGQNQLPQLVFQAGGCAKRRAIGKRRRHAIHHRRVRVAQDERSPRAAEIDEFVAVGVPDVGARAAIHKQRGAPDRFEGANWGEFTPPGNRDCALSNKAAEEER